MKDVHMMNWWYFRSILRFFQNCFTKIQIFQGEILVKHMVGKIYIFLNLTVPCLPNSIATRTAQDLKKSSRISGKGKEPEREDYRSRKRCYPIGKPIDSYRNITRIFFSRLHHLTVQNN